MSWIHILNEGSRLRQN